MNAEKGKQKRHQESQQIEIRRKLKQDNLSTMSMHSEVENMLLEMKSDKAQPKQKAFHKMDNILNGRLKELKQVILNSNSLSWQEIYSAAHSGIQSHARKLMDKEVMPNMNDPKISIYSKVLINICNIISNPGLLFINNLLLKFV